MRKNLTFIFYPCLYVAKWETEWWQVEEESKSHQKKKIRTLTFLVDESGDLFKRPPFYNSRVKSSVDNWNPSGILLLLRPFLSLYITEAQYQPNPLLDTIHLSNDNACTIHIQYIQYIQSINKEITNKAHLLLFNLFNLISDCKFKSLVIFMKSLCYFDRGGTISTKTIFCEKIFQRTLFK